MKLNSLFQLPAHLSRKHNLDLYFIEKFLENIFQALSEDSSTRCLLYRERILIRLERVSSLIQSMEQR